jgi:bifunctional non-homologous end joining protein LigD
VFLPQFQPLALSRARKPFSHRDWLFEIKWDGFRSVVRLEHGKGRLISRNGNELKSFSSLKEAIAAELGARTTILDGEIVCLDADGRPQFRDLLFRKGEPRFMAFDLLWLDGKDLRYLSLSERKLELRRIIPKSSERLLYCDHIEGNGEALFRLVCEKDLEGIVAKEKFAPYQPETRWLKIRNQSYSQWAGREELFEGERSDDPDMRVWSGCVQACVVAADVR